MTAPTFALGRFAADDRNFVGIVFGDRVATLCQAAAISPGLKAVSTIDELLEDWEASFDALMRIAGELERAASLEIASLKTLGPIKRPPRILNAAANYSDHVAGMRKTFTSGLPTVDDAKPLPELMPYLFAKVCPVTGPYDDIILPPGMQRIDWEAELAVVIGRSGRNIPRERVADHIAGYMTGNDVSCRDRTWREDRPAIRSDWLTGKSYDSFSPIGPLFVPKAFVPDHANLWVRLWINGELKQDGNSRDMIFDIEDQIMFASQMITLRPGDIFHTGTPKGTGQERGEFLKAGDLVETEIEFCGRQRNHVVQGDANYWRD